MSGQITPLLIAVLVVLLVASIATINIGRVSLDKTCSANAADAGSLAAASYYAAAFNTLSDFNEQMQVFFDVNYYTYGQIYAEADSYIQEAIAYALASSAAAAGAYFASDMPPSCDRFWTQGLISSVLDSTASWLAFEASQSVSAFNISVQFLKSITDSFHEQQWKNYCDIRDFMDESYDNSRKTGLEYAFLNSCISSKLSDTQNDAFSAWISAEGPYNEGTYSWQDDLSQTHTVSAALDLPAISSYELQHTEGSYPEISDLLDYLIDRSQIIAGVLNSTAVILGSTAALYLMTFVSSTVTAILYHVCAFAWPHNCYGLWMTWCSYTWKLYLYAYVYQGWIVSTLAAIVAASGATSVYLLKSKNDEAFDKWAPDGIYSSTSCGDAGGLMIVKISEVILPSWIATCLTTQQHPGTSAGIVETTYPVVTSISKSKFSGGDVGTFQDTYDPAIVETK